MELEPGWVMLMGASVGAGVYTLLRVADRWVGTGRPPAEFRRWNDELEVRALRAVQADMAAAEARAALVEIIDHLPADYDPSALLAVNIAAGVHRAVVANAERAGLIRRGTFERVYGSELAPEKDEAMVVVEEHKMTKPREEARPRWENGKLVVR